MTTITFLQTPTVEDSLAIVHLKELILENTPIIPLEKKDKIAGAKGDITTALEIINLAFTTVTTFISVLEFWKSQHHKYSITLSIGENTFNIDNLSKEEFEKELNNANEKFENSTLTINH